MSPVQPSATKSRHVRISVAIVIPEIGFEDVPIRPGDTGRHGREEEAEDQDQNGREDVALQVGRPGVTVRKTAEQQRPAEDDGHRNVALGSQPRRATAARAEVA